jgi:filamentous hemagglutinin
VNCAIATDATLAGRPASALPLPPGLTGLPLSVIEKTFNRVFGRVSGIGAIEKIMQAAGDTARGIVYVNIEGSREGHVFNVVNQGGKIVYLDGQSGTVATTQGNWTDVRLLRTN